MVNRLYLFFSIKIHGKTEEAIHCGKAFTISIYNAPSSEDPEDICQMVWFEASDMDANGV